VKHNKDTKGHNQPSHQKNHTVPIVPTGAKVPLLANRFFLSSACCVLVASVFAGA